MIICLISCICFIIAVCNDDRYDIVAIASFCLAFLLFFINFIVGITCIESYNLISYKEYEKTISEKEIVYFTDNVQTDLAADGSYSGIFFLSQGEFIANNKTYMRYSFYVKTKRGLEWKTYTGDKNEIYIDEYEVGKRDKPTVEKIGIYKKSYYKKKPNIWFYPIEYFTHKKKNKEDCLKSKYIVIHVLKGTIQDR